MAIMHEVGINFMFFYINGCKFAVIELEVGRVFEIDFGT